MQLVINTPGSFITQKDACFRLKLQDRVMDVSPLKVESIVITNQAMISSQAIVLALEHNIDIIFLDGYGDPVGRVWFSKMGSTALIRRRQLEAMPNALGLSLVLDMVRQKLANQITFLKKLMYARPGQEDNFLGSLKEIENCKSDLNREDQNLEAVRQRLLGLEGTAARHYFQCLSGVLPQKYRFAGRSRRPALDPFNACL
ncbi:MAG TPA: CRISPR-associated endonuclease Cas1, partial [Desulfobacterales bacterium]|nr:CRISPR-associated endonuclease Cas1 [Desulfobacterales bacterium]